MSGVDVCLLLEGTYPMVRGGVSEWVHQIVRGLPELRFALIFLGGNRNDYGEPRYELPTNAVHFERHFLEDAFRDQRPSRVCAREAAWPATRALHAYLKAGGSHASVAADERPQLEAAVDTMLTTLGQPEGVSFPQFLFSEESWEFVRESHFGCDANASFVDYFWTVRLMHGPIFQLASIAAQAPDARVYHTVSTGYAGLLGAMLALRRKRPLILSEHGIYTKERRIDLNQATWIDELRGAQGVPGAGSTEHVRRLWIRYFEGLGRLTYRCADPIISLYAANRERQLRDGAAPERTRIIANGIDIERFGHALVDRPAQPPRVIGLVGRVVPIKDIKTFIRAIHYITSALPDAAGWVIGDDSEDPAYRDECQALVQSLGLGQQIAFLGHRNVLEIFPRLGLLMLTSISESQPLAVLEAFAAGVPCITTDVGACREQIEGRTPEDRALGAAGEVVRFADPEALGRAAVDLLSHPDKWQACRDAGLTRVRRHYTERAMLHAYSGVYRSALSA